VNTPVDTQDAVEFVDRALAGDLLPEFSEEALALRFASENEGQLHYVAPSSNWMHWDGTHWQQDRTGRALDRVRALCRDAAKRAKSVTNDGRLPMTIASAKTVSALERLARVDHRIAATVEQWDGDPWLLNTPAGTVDLRTGLLRKHDPTDYITKMTAVSPGGECPLFRRFLSRITGEDDDLQKFLARVFGYALTGSTREHALFFCYGSGANGKSVLLNTLSKILGDYACTAPVETFTASHSDRHPTELARLRGARLVTATETERGRSWSEARIKSLSAGDKIAARYMRQDYFEFLPAFKLVIAGNHKPGLQSVDEAMRRRFHMLSFDVTIPTDERDPDLSEKLKAEAPGILQWMLDGCADWQRSGLRPPKIVTDATDEYLHEQDAIGAWMAERCQVFADAQDKSSNLFASFKGWAVQAGEPAGTNKFLASELQKRGFKRKRTGTGSAFVGIRVTPEMYADER
jgi:putative DNA primase/helicase